MNENVVVAVIALVLGAILVLRGYSIMRFAISLFGAVVGFVLGGSIAAQAVGTGFLGGVASWAAALVGALLVGAVAFGFYKVGIAVALAGVGYGVVSSVLASLGVSQSWMVHGAGMLAAVLLFILAITMDLPALLIVVTTSLGGAELVVLAVRLLTGNTTVQNVATTGPRAALVGLWWVLGIGIAALGLISQSRHLPGSRASAHRW